VREKGDEGDGRRAGEVADDAGAFVAEAVDEGAAKKPATTMARASTAAVRPVRAALPVVARTNQGTASMVSMLPVLEIQSAASRAPSGALERRGGASIADSVVIAASPPASANRGSR
jgi:hypothetical protein